MLQDTKVINKTEKQPEKEKGAGGDGEQEVRIFVWFYKIIFKLHTP